MFFGFQFFLSKVSFLTICIFLLASCGGGGSSSGSGDSGGSSGSATSGGSATTGGSDGGDSGGSSETPFSISVESSVENDLSNSFSPNDIRIVTSITGESEEKIGFVLVSFFSEDDLAAFSGVDTSAFSGDYSSTDLLAIYLEPNDDFLRPGTYSSQLGIEFCTDESCDTHIGEPIYFVDYTLNYIAEDWKFFIDHANVESIVTEQFFGDEYTIGFLSSEGEVLDPVSVELVVPEEYSGYELSQTMIEELQVTDITETGFAFVVPTDAQGYFSQAYEISFVGGDDSGGVEFGVSHSIFPQGISENEPQLLSSDLILTLIDGVSSEAEAIVFLPFDAEDNEDIDISYSFFDCDWLNDDVPFSGIEKKGLNTITFTADKPFDLSPTICDVEVQFDGVTFATFNINLVTSISP